MDFGDDKFEEPLAAGLPGEDEDEEEEEQEELLRPPSSTALGEEASAGGLDEAFTEQAAHLNPPEREPLAAAPTVDSTDRPPSRSGAHTPTRGRHASLADSPSLRRQDSETSGKAGPRGGNARMEPSPGQTVLYREPATSPSPYTPERTTQITGSPLPPGVTSSPGSGGGRRVSIREGNNTYPTRVLATGDVFISDTPANGPLMSKEEEEGLNRGFRSGIAHAGWLHKLVGKTPLDVHWKKYWSTSEVKKVVM
ncbi:hypothetical protein TSOC_001782 [Tetrabaena socialis]|uniref:Uncharacterized protein n=1 Tax=Tetrabaena socialis TaxID=47790 RepID=A0A2J8AFW8_9CHLO|nr:hypothetical protein TSOC_001782 [Tetrabaena socialis]|eukprot:PNH11409.1 hypothetical protein TSOC_001782 [Tetrabaena socialis]